MTSSKKTEFLKQYEKYVREILVPTRKEIKGLFQNWKEPGYWAPHIERSRLPAPSPVQRAFPRIKRPESVVDKILRKPSDFPDGLTIESVRNMHDAVAARVIVYFLSNLPLVHRELLDNLIISNLRSPRRILQSHT